MEQDIFIDLNEAEYIGSSDRVHIVAQLDRFEGGFDGDGDWASTKRFYVTRDTDLNHLASTEVQDLGEVAMSDGETLVDFITWAAQSYPADKHVLIMSDHGSGWTGGWSDPAPGGRGQHDIALAEFGDDLFATPALEAEIEIQAPGATEIEMTPLILSSEFVTMDEPLIIQTEVSGEQIANIFLFVGYYDEESDSILVIDMDYIEPDASKEVNGVAYPDWEEVIAPEGEYLIGFIAENFDGGWYEEYEYVLVE